MTAEKAIGLYRSRNQAEGAFGDLEHGIGWRPARCTDEKAIEGRIPIGFLALFCIPMVRSLHPGCGSRAAESIRGEPSSFSLTVLVRERERKRRISSDFALLIRLLRGRIRGRSGGIPRNRTPLDVF